jgi:hypothetical protein
MNAVVIDDMPRSSQLLQYDAAVTTLLPRSQARNRKFPLLHGLGRQIPVATARLNL